MAIGQRRGLSSAEIALARVMFGPAIAYERVRILQAWPLGFGAMVPLGTHIIFSRWRAARDFAQAPVEEQAWFIHEMAHVWQAVRGVMLPLAKLRALGAGAYRVRLHPGQPFAAYNIEAQAEIARLVWLARRGCAPEDTGLEALWRQALS
jgi:hypothetical protein